MAADENFLATILSGNTEAVAHSLANGANVNQPIEDQLPLTHAILNGEEDVAVYLIKNGADIKIPPIPPEVESREDVVAPGPGPPSADEIPWVEWAFAIISIVSQALAVQEIWLSILAAEFWPQQLQPMQTILASQTLSGYILQQLLMDMLLAIYHRRFWQDIKDRVRFSPTYLGIYLIGFRNKDLSKVQVSKHSARSIAGILMGALQRAIWQVEFVSSFFCQELIWAVARRAFERLRKQTKHPATEPAFGGSAAVQAVIKYQGCGGKIAKALLKQGIFTSERIQRELGDAESEVIALWWWANKRGYDDVVRILLEMGLPPLLRNERVGESALEKAARLGNTSTVEVLLGFIPDSEICIQALNNALLSTAMGLDVVYDGRDHNVEHRTLLASLMHSGADVNTISRDQRTPLSFAAKAGDVEAVDLLLEHGANVSIADNFNKTAMLFAPSTKGGILVIRKLVQAGADIDHTDNDGNTALLTQARLSNTEIVKVLIAEGANPLLTPKSGETALQMAANYCMSEMMRILLEAGADPQVCNRRGREPVILASTCHAERAKALSILLKAGASPSVSDETGRTPLHLVCKSYSTTLSNSSDYSDQFLAAKALIEYGVDVNATYTDERMASEQDVTAIGLAARHAPTSVKYSLIKLLLEAEAFPDGLDDRGVPAVVAACEDALGADSTSRELDSVELLLSAGADVNFKSKRKGRTLMHYAADHLNFISSSALLSRDIDINAKDTSGMTALHLASNNSYWMTMDDYHTWKDAGMYSGSEKYANWHCSIESTLLLHTLHVGDANIYLKDSYGATPLHMASKAGNPRISSMLLLQTGPGLLYDYPDLRGRLAFHYAAISTELMRMLLHYHLHNELRHEKYFQVLAPEKNTLRQVKNEVIEKATHMWHLRKYTDAHPTETVDENTHPLPWRRGACNAKDKFGNTPLHYAALAGNAEVVEMYLELEDVDPTAANDYGETALNFAIEQRQCALKILRKLKLLAKPIPSEPELETVRIRRSRGWVEAETFVVALRKEYHYGVYENGGLGA